MKKTVHIITHSHLDREWYLPLIEHQMYLVDLIDNILILSKDKRFKSFHLDGQVIPLDDYFDIKPHKRDEVLKLIEDGKLIIGPWYVMQDAFLTSSESNLRNLQLGMRVSQNYLPKNINIEDHSYIGYFPDTFGNPGQMPQVLKRANIDIAYFGRGVKATGFNNVVLDDYQSKNSEIIWESKDESKVLAILFANWYSNANEIPNEREEAKKFWDKKLQDAETFAATSHLLMMNGCDHQPLQKDVLDAIDLANTLYDDYEFIHSSIKDYSMAVKKEIQEKNIELSTIKGELRSQNTDGWYTLQGTSSNRVYLKQMNKKAEFLLEEMVEPILTSLYSKENYPYDKIHYAYKRLISNHPHDSICGCGIDSVHKGMENRFRETTELANHLIKRALYDYSKNADTKDFKDGYYFTLHNMTQYSGLKNSNVTIDLKRIYFNEMDFNMARDLLKKESMPKSAYIYNGDELIYKANLKDTEVIFDYELPDDKFRQAYFAKRVHFDVRIFMEEFSRKTFRVEFSDEKIDETDSRIIINANVVENDYIKLIVNKDGSFDLTDKTNGNQFLNLGVIENTGDVGNEYIFKESIGDRIYSNQNDAKINIYRKDRNKVIIDIEDTMYIPISAEDYLLQSQKDISDLTKREIKRKDELVLYKINKIIEVDEDKKTLKMNLKFNNIAKDHRLRILFGNNIKSSKVYPESIYEIATRNIIPSVEWQNPDNSQNLNRFVNYRDDKKGITIGTDGIAEYEVLKDNTLALTIGRYTGELGDWGYFKTEDSQAIREFDLKLYINIHDEDYISSVHEVLESRKVYLSNQVFAKNNGNIKTDLKYDIDVSSNLVTAFKRSYNKDIILRLCNYDMKKTNIKLNTKYEMDIVEKKKINTIDEEIITVLPYEIRTFKLEE